MKKSMGWRLIPFVLATLASCATTTGVFSPSEIYERVAPSVAAVATPWSTGSAVALDNGWIITNAHVVWPFTEVSLRFPNRSPVDVDVVYVDLSADFALLSPVDGVPRYPIVPTAVPSTGGDVYLVGYPVDNVDNPVPSISAGIVSRTRTWESVGLTYVQTDTAASPGQSGGVLVDSAGHIVGLSGHVLGANDFALSLWVNDVLRLTEELVNGPTMIEANRGRGFSPESAEVFDYTLRNEWDGLELGLLDGRSSLELAVESDSDVDISVVDPFGYFIGYADDTLSGAEFLRVDQLIEYDHDVIIACFDAGGPLTLESSAPLHRRLDPDDGGRIAPDDLVRGVLDHPNDFDFFYLDLEAGQTVTVTVESVMIDPYLYFDIAGDIWAAEDDDSGQGVLGLDSQLVIQASRPDEYLVVVCAAQGASSGGYIVRTELAESRVPGAIRYPSEEYEPEPTEDPTDSRSTDDPEDVGEWDYFDLRPAGWVEDTQFFESMMEGFLSTAVRFGGGYPYLGGYDPNVLLMAFPTPRAVDLQSVVDENINVVQAQGGKLISREARSIAGEPAELIHVLQSGTHVTQAYVIIGSTTWVIQVAASTPDLRDEALILLDAFNPGGSTAEGNRARTSFQMEMADAFSTIDFDDVEGALEVVRTFRDRAFEVLGPEDDISIRLHVMIAAAYVEEYEDYEAANDAILEIFDFTPRGDDVKEELAYVLNNTAWAQREDGPYDLLVSMAERSVQLTSSTKRVDFDSLYGRLHTLAMVRYFAGDTNGAIEALSEAVEGYPTDVGTDESLVGYWLDLAFLLEDVGRESEAAELRSLAEESGLEAPEWGEQNN